MALLASGKHFCINRKPLDDLLHLAGHGSGLHIPDMRMIHGTDDLRRHMRLLWLQPLSAHCATGPQLIWFPLPQGPPESGPPLTEAEKEARLKAARNELRAALEEEGIMPSEKPDPPPP